MKLFIRDRNCNIRSDSRQVGRQHQKNCRQLYQVGLREGQATWDLIVTIRQIITRVSLQSILVSMDYSVIVTLARMLTILGRNINVSQIARFPENNRPLLDKRPPIERNTIISLPL